MVIFRYKEKQSPTSTQYQSSYVLKLMHQSYIQSRHTARIHICFKGPQQVMIILTTVKIDQLLYPKTTEFIGRINLVAVIV